MKFNVSEFVTLAHKTENVSLHFYNLNCYCPAIVFKTETGDISNVIMTQRKLE